MPIQWATVEQLEVSLQRPLEGSERLSAEQLLTQARIRILAKFPTLESLVDDGTVLPEVPAIVQLNMVARVLNDPMGVTTQAVDGMSYSRDRGIVGGYIKLTAEDLAMFGIPATFATIAPEYNLRRGRGNALPLW